MHNRIIKNKSPESSIGIKGFFLHACSCITGLLCCLLFIAGTIPDLCSARSLQNTAQDRKSTTDQQLSPRVMGFQERLEHLLSPIVYTYTPAGKPDPFKPFLSARRAPRKKKARAAQIKDKRPDQCATPLECMDVGQLKLVAIVTENNGLNMAMAQDASGIGYVLTPGISVGYRNGHIAKIMPDRVIVKEDVENIRGETIITERVLFLHPEEK